MIITPKLSKNIKAIRTNNKKANFAIIVFELRKLVLASTTDASPKLSNELETCSVAADTLSLIEDAISPVVLTILFPALPIELPILANVPVGSAMGVTGTASATGIGVEDIF
jgi:hypothetical protein